MLLLLPLEQARSHKLTEFNCQHRAALLFCGSWLACDAGTSVYQAQPVDAIAGKPAPTLNWVQLSRSGRLSGRLGCAFASTTRASTVGAGLLSKAVCQ
ncbi:hypothetical protein C7U57_14440 [Pseudomonas sp. R9.37]|nr:hypothetical protein C7U57_14440 [Pseudomonas sp. R9.37]